MSLSSTTSRNDYTGNGSVNAYSYTFKIFAATDIAAWVSDTSTPPIQTKLVLGVDYTITGVKAVGGGTLTLVSSGQSWLSAGNLTTGFHLTIRRIRTLTQTTDIRNQGAFFPEIHEDTFDELVMNDQQLWDAVSRSIKNPETVPVSSFDPTLPTDIAQPTAFIMTDVTGTKLVAQSASGAIGLPAPGTAGNVLTSDGSGDWISAAPSGGGSGSVASITANTTAASNVGTYFCNPTGGAFTVTLPAASSAVGYRVTIKNIQMQSGNSITIARTGSDQIEGGSSATLAPGDVMTFQNDGTNYWQVA